ncbi:MULTISPECIES: TrmB family transcriptional regulator [unclassified Haloparvum]|uniref:TrmB family transcriptional regulator n=1 Tax=Haloparvum sp. PAK95 TaxID=3418962 RepID=UPI003D2EF059
MESLRDLGLSSYEARAYRALLSLGTGTATAVAEESEVPKGRIYDALGGLVSRGIAREQTASEPKRYVAVEPAVAVDRLVEARTRELSERIEAYEAGRDELVEQLSGAERPAEEFWTAAVGAEESIDLLFERIDAAEESIVVAADTVSGQYDLHQEGPAMMDHLLSAMDRDVEVSVLLSPRVFDDALEAIADDRAAATIAQSPFELRITEQVYGNFHLMDEREVCLEVSDPFAPDRLFGLLDLREPSFATQVAEGFAEVWAEAEPVEDV